MAVGMKARMYADMLTVGVVVLQAFHVGSVLFPSVVQDPDIGDVTAVLFTWTQDTNGIVEAFREMGT